MGHEVRIEAQRTDKELGGLAKIDGSLLRPSFRRGPWGLQANTA
jgi:hypothetical protein